MRDVFNEEKEALRTRYREKRPATQAVEQGPAPLPLLEVFDAYAKEQQLKPSTVAEWRNNLDALVTFLGHSDALRITVDDLDRWRDMLLATPTKRGTVRLPRSVNNHYFVALRATLAWAVEKRKLTANVATQVVIRIPKRAKLRERNFTTVESNAILAATLLPVPGTASNYTKLARRWIPWLCAYTGARVNEIGQLRGNDIAQIDGLWSIRITPEAGTQKGDTARIIPLHSHLVDQGFIAIANKAGELPIFYDPAAVKKPGDGNRYVKKVGERLAAWVRNDVGITDPNLQPNHAWRHTFKTIAIDTGMMERVSDAITGHAAKTVGQTYGSVSLKAMSAAVEQLPRYKIGVA
jgi:integrase